MKQTLRTASLSLFALAFFMISQTAFGQTKTSSTAFEIKNEDLKEYLGKYDPDGSGGFQFSITISLDGDDRLMAQPTDKSQPNTLMVTVEKDSFDLSGTPLNIAFTRDEDLKIVSLTFTQGNQSFTAKKVKTP